MPDRSRKRYTVTAEPDGTFWFLRIQERPDLVTQARHAGEIELMARDLIAANDEVGPESFDLVLPDVDDRLIRPAKRPRDFKQLAKQIVGEATGQAEHVADTRDPLAVELGRRGGLKGGKARAEKLSPERRSEIARKAAAARWRPD